MLFNSMQREEPYLGLTIHVVPNQKGIGDRLLAEHVIGIAWLSSARVVRCWVKSRNERNPYP